MPRSTATSPQRPRTLPLEARREVYRLIEQAGPGGLRQDVLREAFAGYTDGAFFARLARLEEDGCIRSEVRHVRPLDRRSRRVRFLIATEGPTP